MSLLEKLVEPTPPGGQAAPPKSKKQPHPAIEHIREGKWVLDVIPYTASADKNASYFLPWFWQRLKEEGLIELYFPGAAETSFGEFCVLFTNPSVKKLLFLLKDPSTLDNEMPTVVDCVE